MRGFLVVVVLSASTLTSWADEAAPPVASQPELRQELLERTKVDQNARKSAVEWRRKHTTDPKRGDELSAQQQAEWDQLWSAIADADAANTRWLKGIVEQHGWPTNAMVGQDGAQAAWLLVQHADADPKFQRICLDLMTALPKDMVSQSNLAYLTDRVLLAEGKQQRYGTQFESVDGKMQPRPLEDPANVDQRRAEMGLPPLAEYAELIEKMYSSEAK